MADFYYGADLLPEIPVVDGKPYCFIRRNNNYYKYEVFYAGSQFYYDNSTTALYTKDGSNCTRYELAMGADGVWTYVDENYNYFGVEAGRDCIFANADVYNGASSTDVWMAGMTPVLDNSGDGNFYYGTELLPKLPVLYGYPNVWIRKNSTTGRYDAIYADADNKWYYDGNMTSVSTSRTIYWYRMFIDGGTEWTFSQTTTSPFGVDVNKPAIWSRYDIPNGSSDATDIYLVGNEPVPEFPPVAEIGTKYLVKDVASNTLYTIVDGALSVVDAELTADTFITYGVDNAPSSELLLTLSHFSVLAWNEEYVPEISASVTATPKAQVVVSDRAYLTYDYIAGIENVTAICEGDLICTVSVDGRQTWKKWNGTEWETVTDAQGQENTWDDINAMTWSNVNTMTWNYVKGSGYEASNDGMSKEVLEAITIEQWDALIADASGMYLRIVLIDGTQSVEEIKINYKEA